MDVSFYARDDIKLVGRWHLTKQPVRGVAVISHRAYHDLVSSHSSSIRLLRGLAGQSHRAASRALLPDQGMLRAYV